MHGARVAPATLPNPVKRCVNCARPDNLVSSIAPHRLDQDLLVRVKVGARCGRRARCVDALQLDVVVVAGKGEDIARRVGAAKGHRRCRRPDIAHLDPVRVGAKQDGVVGLDVGNAVSRETVDGDVSTLGRQVPTIRRVRRQRRRDRSVINDGACKGNAGTCDKLETGCRVDTVREGQVVRLRRIEAVSDRVVRAQDGGAEIATAERLPEAGNHVVTVSRTCNRPTANEFAVLDRPTRKAGSHRQGIRACGQDGADTYAATVPVHGRGALLDQDEVGHRHVNEVNRVRLDKVQVPIAGADLHVNNRAARHSELWARALNDVRYGGVAPLRGRVLDKEDVRDANFAPGCRKITDVVSAV